MRWIRRLAAALTLAVACAVGAQELILRDFATLENLGSVGGERAINGWSRVRHRGDTLEGTSYVDVGREMVVDVTVQRFGDPIWVVHELEGTFRTLDGARFDMHVTVVDTGRRRRFELADPGTAPVPVGLPPPKTNRVVAWTSDPDCVVEVTYVLGGPGRLAEATNEIVDAYLERYPSSLPETLADTDAHHAQWVRDEMRRILAYAERDFASARAVGMQTPPQQYQRDAQQLLIRFSGFRERFYGVGTRAAFEEVVRAAEVAHTRPGTFQFNDAAHRRWLEERGREFRRWWEAHQNDPVRLRPAPGGTPTS